MRPYQALRFYNPMTDCDCYRLSIFDGRGGEFFRVVPVPSSAKAWRDQREEVLATIEQAIEMGLQPGEVVVDPEPVDVAG